MWIAVAGVAVIAIGGYTVYSVVSDGRAKSNGSRVRAVASFFAEPDAIRTAAEAEIGESWLQHARKLTIDNQTAELLLENSDGVVRRYTLYAEGRVLRRGGAQRVAADSFDLRDLRFDQVPSMIDEAGQATGHRPRHIVVGRDQEGVLLWRIVPAGAGADTYFAADGQLIANPDE